MADTLLAITGGAGRIGSALRPLLREHYRLRLIDVRHVEGDLAPTEESVVADLSHFADAERALAGVDAVLHLAGDPRTGATWPDVRERNIDGTFNVYEAARRSGAKRVVFASTNHVMGFYYLESKTPVDDVSPMRPDSLYGVSKAFGEVLARYFTDAFDISIICIRIGWFTPTPPNSDALNQLWISARDLAQVVRLSLETPRRFGIYNATSANREQHWDLSKTMSELGYAPVDDVADFAVPRPDADPAYVEPKVGILKLERADSPG